MVLPFFTERLLVLRKLIETIQSQAKARNIPEENIHALRLAPDMFHFTRQIQISCDNAKGHCARLSGTEAPKFEDNEKTFDELIARVDKTLEYLKTLTPEAFADMSSRKIELPYASFAGMHFLGDDFFRTYAIPNYMFHETMVYAIARNNGFDIGKKDFFFELPLHKNDTAA